MAGYVNLLFADYYARTIREQMARTVYDNAVRNIEIRSAKAGQDALIYGICTAVFKDMFESAW